ncbi:hypothetical protein B4133_1857 [Bacillus altitudinis]|uniref:hypothetical protein n=1 Tax=Bacillus altitudinis TaxID=293387 RepID=UPI000597DC34|nr:hypothetical protein [Bacillus altitudinis]KIL29252.1 hypothetical protein B4133_1857 [Bacillus altitudinis]
MMFLSKNVKIPLLLEVKVGFVYGLKALLERFFSFITSLATVLTAFYIIVTPYLMMVCHH